MNNINRYKVTLLLFVAIFSPAFIYVSTGARTNTEGVWTPKPGTAERKAIFDALRAEVLKIHGLKVVFVVDYLKVENGWAWTHTLPQSRDGENHYEDISALLSKKDGKWQVMEIACTEEGNPECLGAPGFFEKLMKRFPGSPPEILPLEAEGS